MAKVLVVVAHVIDVINDLRTDDAVPPHDKCNMSTAVFKGGARVLGGIWPMAEDEDTLTRPPNIKCVIAYATANLPFEAFLVSNRKCTWRTETPICAQNRPFARG